MSHLSIDFPLFFLIFWCFYFGESRGSKGQRSNPKNRINEILKLLLNHQLDHKLVLCKPPRDCCKGEFLQVLKQSKHAYHAFLEDSDQWGTIPCMAASSMMWSSLEGNYPGYFGGKTLIHAFVYIIYLFTLHYITIYTQKLQCVYTRYIYIRTCR